MYVFPQPQRGHAHAADYHSGGGGAGAPNFIKNGVETHCANTHATVGPKVAKVRPKTSKIHQKVIPKSMMFFVLFLKKLIFLFLQPLSSETLTFEGPGPPKFNKKLIQKHT